MTKGSTPTIRWRFKQIPVDIVHQAIMIIRCTNGKRIEKTIETATKRNQVIEWTLTEEETLQLTDTIDIQLQYRANNLIGGSPIYTKKLLDLLRKEPINHE